MIRVDKLYESVSLKASVTERAFVDKLNSSISEIYNKCKLNPETEYEEMPRATSVKDTLDIDSRYLDSIHDNIIYLVTGNNDSKSEAIRKYREADTSVWNDNSKNRRLKRRSW